MPAGFEIYNVISMVSSAVHFVATLVALVIAYRRRWLSTWMYLIIAGLACLCGNGGLRFTFTILDSLTVMGLSGSSLRFALYSLMSVAGTAAWIAVLSGGVLVANDLRDRFQRMRELLDERTLTSTAGDPQWPAPQP